MKKKYILLLVAILFCFTSAQVDNTSKDKILIYKFDIRKEIAKPVWRITQLAFNEAMQLKADYIIIHLNTYGGMVNIADSIRTKIINSTIPVIVFIDNQAISAGALISIAADSIYMRSGGSIGAATVVNQSGEVVPDKYQSFMRSTMRATAESHGKDTIVKNGDTLLVWHRDPKIAEAMVDPVIKIEGIIDSGQVLTFTAEEAMKNGYCEGLAASIKEVITHLGISEYEIKKYKPTGVDSFIDFLLSPIIQSILIMLIVGGIYFELQSPGIGFPLGAAAVAALFYFAPLYLEGLAQNWELIIFIVGLILIALEIFVIPGFGLAGILGIVLVISGLTLSLVDNFTFRYDRSIAFEKVIRAFFLVVFSFFASFILSIYLSKKIFTPGHVFKGLALNLSEDKEDGYVGIDYSQKNMIGKTGIAYTMLRPSGKIEIDGEIYDAKCEYSYINKGDKIKVIRDETGQLYVIKA